MNQETQRVPMVLTGRIKDSPSKLLHEMVLQPQFDYELEHLLPFYLQIEMAMISEYKRLGLITKEASEEILSYLDQINKNTIVAESESNMSDICFAIEKYVETRLTHRAEAWHVDRSRNDVQATAQVMFARKQLLDIVGELLQLSEAIQTQAIRTMDMPMPGYTHYQPAQIITPGFYFAAVNEQIGKSIKHLLHLFDELNECPLGSGAMAGLELEWDREALAERLGFLRPCRHALTSVASKDWMIQIGAELSNLSVSISRFVTDLINWGSSEYRLIDLPDQLSGISSAMPQKKNFPVLERIRGKTAHITAYYLDFAVAQRNTPFTNLVETAKEGGNNFATMINHMKTLLRLYTSVMEHLQFQEERMYEICTNEFFGGFSIANQLSLRGGIPYRMAQALAGRYIVGMMQRGRRATEVDANYLQEICRAEGYEVTLLEEELQEVCDVTRSLHSKKTLGSTHPDQVKTLLYIQEQEREAQRIQWKKAEFTLTNRYSERRR